MREIVQGASKLHPCEAATGNDKGKKRRTKSGNQIVVRKYSPCGCSTRACIALHNYQTVFWIHSRYDTSYELSTVQAAPQRRTDVTGFQAASCHFREHWSK